jgi:hydrogenase maturation protease
LAEAIGLARALNQLPNKLVAYGIEGKNFESGAALSTEVRAAVDEVVSRIREELSHAANGRY